MSDSPYSISQIVKAILKLAHFSKKGEIAAIGWTHCSVRM